MNRWREWVRQIWTPRSSRCFDGRRLPNLVNWPQVAAPLWSFVLWKMFGTICNAQGGECGILRAVVDGMEKMLEGRKNFVFAQQNG